MWIFLILFILGTAIGSFLNVVVCRLPEKRSIIKGRSCCPHCQNKLKAKDLVPLFSFLFLKGQCRDCRQPISWQYPVVELLTGLLFVLIGYLHGLNSDLNSILAYRDLVFVSALLITFFTDLKYYLLFPAVMVPMMFFSLVINTYIFADSGSLLLTLSEFVLAGLVAGGFFWLQYVISKGNWIGQGDIQLGFLLGFMLGLPGVILALFLAYLLGAFISGFLLALKKKNLKSQMPFGVFLTLGAVIALFWAEPILRWYFNLL